MRKAKKRFYKGVKRVKKFNLPRNFMLFCLSAGILIFSIFLIWVFSFKIPDLESFNERKIHNSTKIYDRTEEYVLYNIYQDVKRTDILFEDMGVNIKNATIAIEDSEFYNHKGIRIKSIIRAVLFNVFGGEGTQGGSTITQQLVKNTLLTQRVTIARKIKEWVLALKIEKVMSKDEILEFYLNEAPYGGSTYGIQEASITYFGKEPVDLTLAESSYLAAIPQSPTYLSPYGKHIDKLNERKNLVLYRMLELGYINQEEYDQALFEEVEFKPQVIGTIAAPHFVFFIKNYLEEKYGSDLVLNGGLKVVTTLDYELQQKAEEIVKEEAIKNEETQNGKNAALVAIDPKTGQIISMVGSRDYFDTEIDGNFNVAADGLRQPGSSFKPFIYATAFNKGFSDKTVLFDLPTEFYTGCNPYGQALAGRNQDNCYMPQNYDGDHRGPMTLRDALAQSINIPAVKLFYLAGLQNSLKTAEDLGISTLTDINRYGLTLVIGGGEVTLLDMTSAYSVLANRGLRNPYTGVLRVEDSDGNILEEFTPNQRSVIQENTTLMISDILSDNEARTPTFGANSVLLIPGKDVAVKTGTTNSNKDAWTIGYSPSIAVGVWAGNNDNTPMRRGGSAVAGPIWNRFIVEALKKFPNESFSEADFSISQNSAPILRGYWQGGEGFLIDKISGKLATEYTPKETLEEKVVTNVHNILHWIDKDDIFGPFPKNPDSDPQYNNWEVAVQNWWSANKYKYPLITLGSKPKEEDDVHIEENIPVIKILEPSSQKVYDKNDVIFVSLEIKNRFPIQKIDAYINNQFVSSYNLSSNFSIQLGQVNNLASANELKLIYQDSVFNKGESKTTFYIN